MKQSATPHSRQSLCQIASATDNSVILKFEGMSNEGNGMLMMRGMTAKNFDPMRYSGREFEVASLKRGFAGQGQEDCHCTQVDTFCVHGGPDGYITGIRGKVQCLSVEEREKAETDLERQEMIREKCYLRFPTLPFIPKEPYDVIENDYHNFALVSGAKDKSFVQVISRRMLDGQSRRRRPTQVLGASKKKNKKWESLEEEEQKTESSFHHWSLEVSVRFLPRVRQNAV